MRLAPPDMENLAGRDTGRDHLSHSRIGTHLACEQREYWHYERRLAPKVTKTSLSMGRAFAEALACGQPQHAWDLILDEHDALKLEAANDLWTQAPTDEDAEITAQIVREAARCYLNRYGDHGETREHTMTVRLRNPQTGAYSRTFDLTGRVDAVTTDFTVLFEDKLVGQIPRREGEMTRRLRLDRQISIGCYLIWRTEGVEVREVRYRMTLKPAIRRTQKETHGEYLDRIAAEYATRPEHYLAEFPCTRTPDDYLRLEQELWRWAEQIRGARLDGVFPRNTAACQDWGGCVFLPLCSQEPGAMHQFRVREEHTEVEEQSETRKEVTV